MSEGASQQPWRPPDAEPVDDVALRVVPTADGVITVIGELDVGSAPLLLAALDGTEIRDVDLSGVTFIDVAGLRALASVDGLRITRSCALVDRVARLCARQGWPPVNGLSHVADAEPDRPPGPHGSQ